MDRKPKPEGYIEPMPRGQFLELMKAFRKIGGKYIANEASERYLEARGVEADTLNAVTILFRRRPTRAAVYEELFHANKKALLWYKEKLHTMKGDENNDNL